jgi:hypothetical protein
MSTKEVDMKRQAVTMRELQKMSAGAIQALPHPVPITSGTAMIGLLVPTKKTDSEALARAAREAREEFEKLSPEMQARIDRFLADRDS